MSTSEHDQNCGGRSVSRAQVWILIGLVAVLILTVIGGLGLMIIAGGA
ncbi:hypothetical protein [Streptomyces boninensis]